MTNRLILSAMITLALAFTPSLAFSVPTQSVKKKSTSNKTQNKVSNKASPQKKPRVLPVQAAGGLSSGKKPLK